MQEISQTINSGYSKINILGDGLAIRYLYPFHSRGNVQAVETIYQEE